MFTYNNEKHTDKFRNGKAACLAFTFVNEHNNDHSPMVIKARTGFQFACHIRSIVYTRCYRKNQNTISQHVWHDKRPFKFFYNHPAKHEKNIL